MELYLILGLMLLGILNVIGWRKLNQSRKYRLIEKRRLDFTLAFFNNNITKEVINAVDLNFLTDKKILPHIQQYCQKIIESLEVKEIGPKLNFIASLDEDKKNYFIHQMKLAAGEIEIHNLAQLFIQAKFFWQINHGKNAESVADFVFSLIEENAANRASFIVACNNELNNGNLSAGKQILPDIRILLQAEIINAKKQLRVTIE